MGKINASDKIMSKNQKKKRENMEIREFFCINLHLKDCFAIEFTAF